mgnify:CR=1 FL=1
MTYTFRLPCYLFVGARKISLNLNWYRNAHHQVAAKVKREFAPVFPWPRFHAEKVAITYTLVLKTRQRTDRMNWVAIVDKFFADWLVQYGYIQDDDCGHYVSTSSTAVMDPTATETHIIAEVEVRE